MKPLLLSAVLSVSLAACATVQHGPVQRIHVETEPAGATVWTDECGPGSTAQAVTPADVWVSRRASRCRLTVAMDGYRTETILLQRAVAEEYFENIELAGSLCGDGVLDCADPGQWPVFVFFGGILAGAGFGIDTATGAMFEQQPSEVWAELVPVEEP